MYNIIHSGLERQNKALQLLHELLREEYQLLLSRDTDAVVAQEFSIHELLRQVGNEKILIIRLLDGGKVRHYAELLPEEQGELIMELYNAIDDYEQICSRQASRNAELSLMLLDHSQRTLKELHGYVAPRIAQTYGRRGCMTQLRPQASYLSGRM